MSGGTWTQADTQNAATRPGLYINFVGTATSAVQSGAQGIVAVAGTADWGVMNGITATVAENQIANQFGSGGTLPLMVAQALRGGATKVLSYRMGVSGTIAKATVTLSDSVPVAALTLTAKFYGARANGFTVKVSVNASDNTKQDLTILEAGSVLEVYTAATNDEFIAQMTGTVTGINASNYVVATISGAASRALATNGSGVLMASGNSGTSVTATEFALALAGIETQTFNLLVADTVDTSIQATIAAFITRLRSDGGKKVLAVLGGQSVSGFSASAFTTEFNAQVALATGTSVGQNVGVILCFPGIVDELTNTPLSGAQSAARAAGMIGKAGFTRSVTKQVTGAADVTYRLVTADAKKGLTSGLLLFTTETTGITIESGINTLSNFTTDQPRSFRKIRVIRTLDAIATTINQAIMTSVVGNVNNDVNGRAYAVGLITGALSIFANAGAIEGNYSVIPDTATPHDPDEFHANLVVSPIDSLEKFFISCRVL